MNSIGANPHYSRALLPQPIHTLRETGESREISETCELQWSCHACCILRTGATWFRHERRESCRFPAVLSFPPCAYRRARIQSVSVAIVDTRLPRGWRVAGKARLAETRLSRHARHALCACRAGHLTHPGILDLPIAPIRFIYFQKRTWGCYCWRRPPYDATRSSPHDRVVRGDGWTLMPITATVEPGVDSTETKTQVFRIIQLIIGEMQTNIEFRDPHSSKNMFSLPLGGR